MRNFLFVFFFLLLMAPCVSHATDSQANYVKKWEDTEAQIPDDPTARARLFEAFSQPASADEIAAGQQWLIDRIANNVTDVGYHITLAQLTWAVGNRNNRIATKNSGTILSVASLLIIQSDLARCQNKAPGKQYYIDTIKVLKDPLAYFQSMSAGTRHQVIEEAKKFEIKIPNRPGNALICGPGQDPKTVKYIPDDEWQKKRQQILNDFEVNMSR